MPKFRDHSVPSATELPTALPSTSPGENENGEPSSVLSLRLCSKTDLCGRARAVPSSTNERLAPMLQRLDAARDVDRLERLLDDVCVLLRMPRGRASRRPASAARRRTSALSPAPSLIPKRPLSDVAVADEPAIREPDARAILADRRPSGRWPPTTDELERLRAR